MNIMASKEVARPHVLGNGKTLKEYRAEIMQRTAATGHYNGLERLERKGDGLTGRVWTLLLGLTVRP